MTNLQKVGQSNALLSNQPQSQPDSARLHWAEPAGDWTHLGEASTVQEHIASPGHQHWWPELLGRTQCHLSFKCAPKGLMQGKPLMITEGMRITSKRKRVKSLTWGPGGGYFGLLHLVERAWKTPLGRNKWFSSGLKTFTSFLSHS